MTPTLKEEIRQTRPFHNRETEAFLNIIRTADALARQVEQLLKPHGLTMTQYNALRILRGAEEKHVTCGYVAERLVTSDPDVTRLFDRMERAGLLERARDTSDRRCVLNRISRAGIRLLAKLDHEIDALHVRQFASLGPKALTALVTQLEQVREATATSDATAAAPGATKRTKGASR
ncbi:MAG: MarR family transcriptional regulator [Thermoanaerobaculia bacterium]|jgi:DNA-binding MarR family transcriptional regulator